jgi:hypothetical protein
MLAQIQSLGQKLKRVVVNEHNVSDYGNNLGRLLDLSGQRQISDEALESGYRDVYITLIKSAAWQESCWRQFVIRGGAVHWLESSTGDIGLIRLAWIL